MITTTGAGPMKAHSLGADVHWGDPHPFADIATYLDEQVWAADLKIDGCRAFLEMGERRNRFGHTRSDAFPQFATAVVPELAGTVLDGEFLAPIGKDGQRLGDSTGLFNSNASTAARTQGIYGNAEFWVFDILAMPNLETGGIEDVTGQSWTDRRRHIEIIVRWINNIHPECGIRLVPEIDLTEDAICGVIAGGGEGVVLKRRDSHYLVGKRARTWLKIKARFTADLVIMGSQPGAGQHAGLIGSIEVGAYDAAGELIPVASVNVAKPALRKLMSAPVAIGQPGTIKPEYIGTVAEVAARGIGSGGRLNLPVLLKLRPDKEARECDTVQLAVFNAV